MPYSWDPASKRFRDPKGRYIGQKDILKLLDVALETKDVVALSRAYQAGQISKEVWHQGMRQAIKNAYLQAAMLAKGGRSQMTPADWGKAGGHISEQFYHLDRKTGNFLSQLDDLTPTQIEARAKMYINSARQVYEEMRRDEMRQIAIYEKWVLGPTEHCEGCIALAQLGIVPIGTLWTVPGAGDTPCLTSCQCRIAYYNQNRRRLSSRSVVKFLLKENIPFTVLLTDFGDVIIPGEWVETESHMCAKLGGPGSGHWGHAGRPGGREPTYLLSEHSGAMVALHIPLNAAEKLALPNGTKPEEMHVTLVYMGESDELDHDTIDRIVSDFARDRQPFSGKVGGLGRFTASKSSEGKDVVYASVDSPDLPEFRQALVEAVGIRPSEHGFIPHITLSYISPSDPLPIDRVEELALMFDAVYVHWGDEVKEYKLGTKKLGGPGSGHHGHKGIPGHRGGSAPSGGGGFNIAAESQNQAGSATPFQFAAVRAYTDFPSINESLRGQRSKPLDPHTIPVDDQAYYQFQADHAGMFLPPSPSSGWTHEEDSNMPLTIDAKYADRVWPEQGQKVAPVQIRMTEDDIIKGVDSAMRPLEQDMVLYRGSLGSENWKLKGGEVFTDKGFTSTAVDLKTTEHYGVDFFEIHVPKGTGAVFPDMFSRRTNEAGLDEPVRLGKARYSQTGEVLLQRGLDYRFIGTKEVSGKTVRIFEAHSPGSLGATKPFAPRISKKKYS